MYNMDYLIDLRDEYYPKCREVEFFRKQSRTRQRSHALIENNKEIVMIANTQAIELSREKNTTKNHCK